MPTYSEEPLGIGPYKTKVATPNQKRTLEFGQHLKGKDINSLLIAVAGPSGKRILFGLQPSIKNPTTVLITEGGCIKDFVVIRILENVELTIPSLDGIFYLVLRYRYQESLPTDDVDILFVTPSTYNLNPSLYLYLSTVVVVDGTLSSIEYDSSIEEVFNIWQPASVQADLIGVLDELYYRKSYLYTKQELGTPNSATIHWSNIVGVEIDGGTW